jgi:hypothetical protein
VVEPGVIERAQALLVQVPQVVHVDVVLDEQLPVAVGLEVNPRHLLEKPGTMTAAVHRQTGKGFCERRRGRIGMGEDHPLPHVGRGGQQSPRLRVEIGKLLLALRDNLQRAIESVAPLVVEALDSAIARAVAIQQLHAAMAAQIVKRA